MNGAERRELQPGGLVLPPSSQPPSSSQPHQWIWGSSSTRKPAPGQGGSLHLLGRSMVFLLSLQSYRAQPIHFCPAPTRMTALTRSTCHLGTRLLPGQRVGAGSSSRTASPSLHPAAPGPANCLGLVAGALSCPQTSLPLPHRLLLRDAEGEAEGSQQQSHPCPPSGVRSRTQKSGFCSFNAS